MNTINDFGLSKTLRARRLGIGLLLLAALLLVAVPAAWAQFPQYQRLPADFQTPWPIGARFFAMVSNIFFGFAVGAFFSPLLRPVRVFIFFAGLVVTVLFAWLGPFPFADIVTALCSMVIFCIAFYFGIQLGRAAARAEAAAAAEKRRPTSFGTAKWATRDYLDKNGLFEDQGFVLGNFGSGKSAAPLFYSGSRHLLTVAPTRAGKGVSSIIPNLLIHEGSALVVDPKGENALITALRRGTGTPTIPGLKQKIVLLDPWDIAASKLFLPMGHFNPLDWIREDDPDAAENAFLLADALVISESHGEAHFWDEEAKALLTGLILYVATSKFETRSRHLGRVRDILVMDNIDFRTIIVNMVRHPHPVVRTTATRTAAKDIKLRGSVMAGAQAHTHFLDSPRIRASLASSDFKFEELKEKSVTIYLILPADRIQTFNRWLRLLIQQAITVNARNISKKPEIPILFLLDEMPTLGRLPSIEQAYGLMAGFGMQIWGIVQDLSQLASVYGDKSWQTFISNSGVIQYFGSRDKMTAEYFSSLCGVTTVEVRNMSWAVGRALSYATSFTSSSGSGGNSSSSNTSGTTDSNSWTRTNGVNEAQRQLAYPDELMVLKGHQQLVFVENHDPIAAEKIVWYKDPALHELGVNLQPPATPPSLPSEVVVAV